MTNELNVGDVVQVEPTGDSMQDMMYGPPWCAVVMQIEGDSAFIDSDEYARTTPSGMQAVSFTKWHPIEGLRRVSSPAAALDREGEKS